MSAASMLLPSLSAVSQSLTSNPRWAEESFSCLALSPLACLFGGVRVFMDAGSFKSEVRRLDCATANDKQKNACEVLKMNVLMAQSSYPSIYVYSSVPTFAYDRSGAIEIG